MERYRYVLAIVLLLLLLAVPASAQEKDAEGEGPLNTECPVMLGEPVDAEVFVIYKGKKVLFCCEDCVADFEASPEEFLADLPQFAVADTTPPNGEEEDSGQGRGRGRGGEEGEGTEAGDADSAGAPERKDPKEEHPFGVLHMIFLHFPIALSAMAALAAVLGLLMKGPFFRNVTTFCVIFAAAFAVPTFLTGGEAEEAKGRTAENLHERIETHEQWGEISMYTLLGVAVLHLVSRLATGSKSLGWLSFVAILAAAGVLAYTGFLGGEVAWGEGHLDPLLNRLPIVGGD